MTTLLNCAAAQPLEAMTVLVVALIAIAAVLTWR